MTIKRINKAIKKFNLEVIKGEGYHYFVDITTREHIGSPVYISYLKDFNMKQWIQEADDARREYDEMYHEYTEPNEEYI